MNSWQLRALPPSLIRPVRIDPSGRFGPTPGQAEGPFWRWTAPRTYVSSAADRNVPEQRILEEASRLPAGGAVTGWAALRLHGAAYFDGLSGTGTELPVPLVVPPRTPLRARAGTAVHRERLPVEDLSVVQGIPAVTAERACLDAARRTEGVRASVVVIDMALAAGILTEQAFRAYLRTKDGWSGVTKVRHAVQLSDSRSMSPKETELRLIWMLDAGLPPPRCNWPVADARGRLIGRPDLLSTEYAVVGEFDGAQHRSRERHRDDLRRDDQFRSVGLEPFRIVGSDLADVDLVLARIKAAIQRSAAVATPQTWLLKANPKPVS